MLTAPGKVWFSVKTVNPLLRLVTLYSAYTSLVKRGLWPCKGTVGSNLFMEKAVVPESTLLKTRWMMLGAPLPRATAKFWFCELVSGVEHLRRLEVEFYCGGGGYWRASSSFFKNYYITTADYPTRLTILSFKLIIKNRTLNFSSK